MLIVELLKYCDAVVTFVHSLYSEKMSHGLQSVRDALILARTQRYITDAEFILLYDHNWSKPLFPYWKFEPFNVDTWDDEECRTELRFAKGELPS